jgi:hypothetical protein
MASAQRSPSTSLLGRFAFGAGAIGLVAGIVYSGPHFSEWTLLSFILVPIACGVVAAILGGAWGYIASRDRGAMDGGGDGPDSMGPFDGRSDSAGAHDHFGEGDHGGHE